MRAIFFSHNIWMGFFFSFTKEILLAGAGGFRFFDRSERAGLLKTRQKVWDEFNAIREKLVSSA